MADARHCGTPHDTRATSKVTHETGVLLRQRLFVLTAGYKDANEHTRLRSSPGLKVL